MTEDAKKVWMVMENDFGWSNQPKDFHLEYFEDIIKATKQALTIPVVVGQNEQLAAFLKWYYENDECPDLVTYEAAAERYLSHYSLSYLDGQEFEQKTEIWAKDQDDALKQLKKICPNATYIFITKI